MAHIIVTIKSKFIMMGHLQWWGHLPLWVICHGSRGYMDWCAVHPAHSSSTCTSCMAIRAWLYYALEHRFEAAPPQQQAAHAKDMLIPYIMAANQPTIDPVTECGAMHSNAVKTAHLELLYCILQAGHAVEVGVAGLVANITLRANSRQNSLRQPSFIIICF